MHDIDRISLEDAFESYEGEGEYGQYETNGFETQYEDAYEHEHDSFFETEEEAENDFEFQTGLYSESPFSEAEELALASQLLNVTNEGELDQFIGKLIRGAGKSLSSLLKTPMGAQLGGIIKGAAKSALPLLGAAGGNFLIPGIGGAMGSKLASAAGSMLGLELEGLSREDQEFELARQIVRFGGAATRNAEEVNQVAPGPEATKQAAVAAAQQYAPGLLRPDTDKTQRGRRRRCRHQHRPEGRWVRQGNKILIIGV
jgi:hypothetical protein